MKCLKDFFEMKMGKSFRVDDVSGASFKRNEIYLREKNTLNYVIQIESDWSIRFI